MKNKTLLIIDKDPYNRRLLEVIFRDRQYILLFAGNKEEAFNLFRAGKTIDLVIIDPIVKDGLQVIGQIKQAYPQLPLIAYTVCAALPEEQELCYRAGCDLHISKPAMPDDIYKTVETMLAKARFMQKIKYEIIH